MDHYPVRHHQQSEIFFILFLFLLLVAIGVRFEKEQVEAERPLDKPPIVTLPEASGYRFLSGSAKLASDFQNKLSREIIPELTRIAEVYKVDVIEVIGHTDGQVIKFGSGNLDGELEDVAHSNKPESIDGLTPASNADLGLMRALSLIKYFQQEQKIGKLKGIQFRPYSAAQLLLPSGQIALADRTPDPQRRRIELRFTRSDN